MAAIAFIGLGQMGSPMASNLLQQGHQLRVFDVNAEAVRHLVDKGAHHDPGQEVRHIGNRLHNLLELQVHQLVHHQGECDGDREGRDQRQQTDLHRVQQHPGKVRIGEHLLELLKTAPVAPPDSPRHLEILERDSDSRHGHIAEQNQKDDRRKRKKVERQVSPHLFHALVSFF